MRSQAVDRFREHSIDPRSVTVQRLAGTIACVSLSLSGLIALVAAIAATSPTRLQALGWLALWAAASVAAGTMAVIWPPLRFRHTAYCLDARGIRIRSGVWWRSTVDVAHSRVQHTDVQQGPIERGFGLATLLIHTAGTHHAVIPLPGLAHEVALGIRDQLLEAAGRHSPDG